MELYIAKRQLTQYAGPAIARECKAARNSIVGGVKVCWPQSGRTVLLIGSVDEIAALLGPNSHSLLQELGVNYVPPTEQDVEKAKDDRLRALLLGK